MAEKKAIFNAVFRICLGFVFFYAGLKKLFLGDFPAVDTIITFMPVQTVVFILGVVELVVGIVLMLGLFTSIFAWIMAALLAVFIILGFPTGQGFIYKNIGLIGAALYLAVEGSQAWGMDNMLKKG